jgi:hypothetical protein
MPFPGEQLPISIFLKHINSIKQVTVIAELWCIYERIHVRKKKIVFFVSKTIFLN